MKGDRGLEVRGDYLGEDREEEQGEMLCFGNKSEAAGDVSWPLACPLTQFAGCASASGTPGGNPPGACKLSESV